MAAIRLDEAKLNLGSLAGFDVEIDERRQMYQLQVISGLLRNTKILLVLLIATYQMFAGFGSYTANLSSFEKITWRQNWSQSRVRNRIPAGNRCARQTGLAK